MSYKDYDLSEISTTASGLDAFFGTTDGRLKGDAVTPKTASAGRVKVASVEQLTPFVRTAADTLVHKIDRDLWSLQKDAATGEYFIERLFDNTGEPIKG